MPFTYSTHLCLPQSPPFPNIAPPFRCLPGPCEGLESPDLEGSGGWDIKKTRLWKSDGRGMDCDLTGLLLVFGDRNYFWT